MRQTLRRTTAAALIAGTAITTSLVVGGLLVGGPLSPITLASAQSQPTSDIIRQIKLTEAHIKGFITAKISEKMQGTPGDRPDPKIQAELEEISKRNGFKDFAEYDDVAANISMVMAGIDPQTGKYSDPITSIRKEIEDVTVDKALAEKDRKQMLEELAEALKITQPLQFPENVELVRQHRVEIDKVLQ